MIHEHDCVVLTCDLPDLGLVRGDVGAVVHVHGQGAAFEVEFVTLSGDTVATSTLDAAQVRPVGRRDVTHVREIAAG